MHKKISFQVLSDIHLEKSKYKNLDILIHPIKADNLILAGDIGSPLKSNYKEYIKFCSENYKRVFLVCGNHEYWVNTIENTEIIIKDICKKYNNIYLLNNKCIEFEENYRKYKIFGSTLWSLVDNSKLYSMDNNLIHNFDFVKRNKLFMETVKNINSNSYDIIITHHSPTFQIIQKRLKGMNNNQLFASKLDHLIRNSKYWICGHLHDTEVSIYDNLITNCVHNEYKDNIIYLD
jgi:predicted MPP superfamily phosphohydrolase